MGHRPLTLFKRAQSCRKLSCQGQDIHIASTVCPPMDKFHIIPSAAQPPLRAVDFYPQWEQTLPWVPKREKPKCFLLVWQEFLLSFGTLYSTTLGTSVCILYTIWYDIDWCYQSQIPQFPTSMPRTLYISCRSPHFFNFMSFHILNIVGQISRGLSLPTLFLNNTWHKHARCEELLRLQNVLECDFFHSRGYWKTKFLPNWSLTLW